jgi:hypothetical protein
MSRLSLQHQSEETFRKLIALKQNKPCKTALVRAVALGLPFDTGDECSA